MGMYTELYLSCSLRADMPNRVLNVLEHLFCDEPLSGAELPNHPFFATDRWTHIGNSSSYYFVPAVVKHFERNSIGTEYCLIFRCDLKNYDDEIVKFLSWLFPYLDNDITSYRHIGHFRYEENLVPTLIFQGKDKLHFVTFDGVEDVLR